MTLTSFNYTRENPVQSISRFPSQGIILLKEIFYDICDKIFSRTTQDLLREFDTEFSGSFSLDHIKNAYCKTVFSFKGEVIFQFPQTYM